MRNCSYRDEAEACRRHAAQFAGRPEGHFLLRVAQLFEELAAAQCFGETHPILLAPDSRGTQ